MKPPQVSIVITCYNYAHFLPVAIESALVQTVPAIEIILVDDGSEDDTAEVAQHYRNRVDYIAIPHGGVCVARNKGLDRARGTFIVFLDADDALAPVYLERTLAAWERAIEPKPAFVYTQRADFETGLCTSHFPAFDSTILKFKSYIMVSSLLDAGAARLVGFDPAFQSGLEDYDFFLSMVERGYHGVLMDEPLLRVRLHEGSRTPLTGAPSVRWRLMKHLLAKHHCLYSRQEKAMFLRNLRQFVGARLSEARRPGRPSIDRWRGVWDLIRYGVPLRYWPGQLRYALQPRMMNMQEGDNNG